MRVRGMQGDDGEVFSARAGVGDGVQSIGEQEWVVDGGTIGEFMGIQGLNPGGQVVPGIVSKC